jgi:hypothetical protein
MEAMLFPAHKLSQLRGIQFGTRNRGASSRIPQYMSDRAVGGTLHYRSIRLIDFLLERGGETGEKAIDKVK